MRVGLAQIIIKDDMDYNFRKIKDYLERAKGKNADLIVFPESCLTGYLGISLDSLEDIDLEKLHRYIKEVSNLAATNRIAVVIGQYLKRCGNWYNNLLFIGKDGTCKNSYDKSHLIDADCYHVTPGEPPVVFVEDQVRFSLGICHDIRYAEHTMWVGINGAQVHIHPFYGFRSPQECMKVQEIYNSMLATRAVENGLYILAPNAANYEQMVRSQVRNPQGYAVVISNTCGEELLVCDIDPALAGKGWINRRRSDLYRIEVIQKNRESFFDKGYWDHLYYMTNHNKTLLNYQAIENKE